MKYFGNLCNYMSIKPDNYYCLKLLKLNLFLYKNWPWSRTRKSRRSPNEHIKSRPNGDTSRKPIFQSRTDSSVAQSATFATCWQPWNNQLVIYRIIISNYRYVEFDIDLSYRYRRKNIDFSALSR